MNVGVIGVGIQGRRHARIYSELKNVNRLFLYDTDEKVCQSVAREYDGIPCKNIQDLLDSCESVSICVPTEYHYEIATRAIDNGVNFLVEKPLTDNYDEAIEIARSTPSNIVAGVGHIERFNPIVNEIKKIINEPEYIEINRHNPSSSRISGTSVIKDLMIHDIDVFKHSFFPDINCVFSAIGGKDVCGVSITDDDGVIPPSYISASRMSSKKVRRIYIEDCNSTVEGDYMTQEIYIYRKPDEYCMRDTTYVQENIVEKVAIGKVEPLRVELHAFLDCCLMGLDFPVTLGQGAENVEMSENIEESINLKNKIMV